MKGVATAWSNEDVLSKGKILGEDGKTYAVIDREIHGDCIGRRFMVVGETVIFDPFRRKRTFLVGQNVIRPSALANVGLSTYRETCEVLYNEGQGARDKRCLLRELGGHLIFRPKNHAHLIPGQIVEVGLRANPNPKGPWIAVHIRQVCSNWDEYNTLPAEKRRARPSYRSLT